ncbi:hypothetical protein NWP22_06580 [Anabaenopsis tanganyikae CS-531]|uniref:Uncharacterized protein n=1 Tax=Anabaenopsis tanganyikae CS-531 TaxID=2785304 RepID=A0ABT6KDR4_9CYAN|nr:hypothetical protein [Anabaenopsis tanganyikae]MDH6105534.1 hypothetical protein [Anabaenopsis tanganyikae CS-531]
MQSVCIYSCGEYRQTSPLFYRLHAIGEFPSVAIWQDLSEGRRSHSSTQGH